MWWGVTEILLTIGSHADLAAYFKTRYCPFQTQTMRCILVLVLWHIREPHIVEPAFLWQQHCVFGLHECKLAKCLNRFGDSMKLANFFLLVLIIAFTACGGDNSTGSDNDTGDTTAPTTPQNLTAVQITDRDVELMWDESTDDRGIANYRVYKNGYKIVDTEVNTYVDRSYFSLGDTANYAITAVDSAGNVSESSSSASVTIVIRLVDVVGTYTLLQRRKYPYDELWETPAGSLLVNIDGSVICYFDNILIPARDIINPHLNGWCLHHPMEAIDTSTTDLDSVKFLDLTVTYSPDDARLDSAKIIMSFKSEGEISGEFYYYGLFQGDGVNCGSATMSSGLIWANKND